MGDTVYLWADAPNKTLGIRMGRENKLKKVERTVVRKLTTEKIKLIDNVLSQHYVIEDGKVEPKETDENKTGDKKKEIVSPTLPKDFIVKWEEMKKFPENFDIRMFFFRKTWRYHGVKGRWVCVFTIWSLEEIWKRRGRRKIIQGLLLEPPIKIIEPLEWEEFYEEARQECKLRNVKMTTERYKRLKRDFKRIPREKAIAFAFVPTATSHQTQSIIEQTTNFGNFISIANFTLSQLEDYTKLPEFRAIATSSKETIDKQGQTISILTDRLGRKESTIKRLHLIMQEKGIPVHISREGAPFPELRTPPPREEKALSKKLSLTPEQRGELMNYLLFGVGLFTLIVGLFVSNVMPLVLVAGLLLTLFFGWLILRRRRMKVPELVEEATEEAAMRVKNE